MKTEKKRRVNNTYNRSRLFLKGLESFNNFTLKNIEISIKRSKFNKNPFFDLE